MHSAYTNTNFVSDYAKKDKSLPLIEIWRKDNSNCCQGNNHETPAQTAVFIRHVGDEVYSEMKLMDQVDRS